jgi:hypothetical protein
LVLQTPPEPEPTSPSQFGHQKKRVKYGTKEYFANKDTFQGCPGTYR